MRIQRVFLEPATIPVDVEDHIHPLAVGVVHHLLHASHPCRIDCERALIGVAIPGSGNAHGIEPGGLYAVDELLGDGRVTPRGFTADGLERIPEVPADGDLAGHLRRRRKRLGECGHRQDKHGHTDAESTLEPQRQVQTHEELRFLIR